MSERGYKIIARIAALILLLLAGVIFAIQLPGVQNRIARFATGKLENAINGKVQYSDIRISPAGALMIKDLVILDDEPYSEDIYGCGWPVRDTFFRAGSITATFTLKGLFKKEGIHMGRVEVNGGAFHLVSEPGKTKRVASNIQRIFNLPDGEDKIAQPGPSIFDIRKFKVTDFTYTMNSFLPRKGEYSGTGMRYDDLDIHVGELRGHGMKFTGGKMYASCDHLDCTEKSGYEMYDLTGDCEVGLGRTLVRNIHLLDPWSDADIPMYSMTYRNAKAFGDFLNNVLIESEIGKGRIAIQTITYFSSALAGNGAVIQTEGGHFKGTVSDFNIDNLVFTDITSGIGGTLNGGLRGIPDPMEMAVDATLSGCHFTTKELKTLLKSVAGITVPALNGIAPGQKFTMDATVTGPLNNAKANATLNSTIGQLKATAGIRNLMAQGKPIDITADIDTKGLDVGKALGLDIVGPVTLGARASASLGKKMSAKIDSLYIKSAQFLGQEFNGIKASGSYRPEDFNATLVSTDPKLNFTLNGTGTGDIAKGNADFKLTGSIRNADLNALGIDKRSDIANASMDIAAALFSTAQNDFNSSATLSNIRITDNAGEHLIPDIDADYNMANGVNHLAMNSDILHAEYDAHASIPQLIASLQDATVRRELPALYKSSDQATGGLFTPFSAELALHDTRELLSYLLPGLYVADGTRFNISMNSDGDLHGDLTSQRLAFGTNYIRNAELLLKNDASALSAKLEGEEFSTGAFSLACPVIKLKANDNRFSVNAEFSNTSAANGTADIAIAGSLRRDEADSLIINAHPRRSSINVDGGVWEFGESDITVRGKDIAIDHFSIRNADQAILIDGGISGSDSDTLNVSINKFGLAIIDSFMKRKYGFGGELNGSAYLISPAPDSLGLMMRMDATDVMIGDTNAGDFKLAGRWDEESKRLKAFLSNELGEHNALMAMADYDPEKKTIEASATLNGMSPKIALPFVSGIFSDLGGNMSGRLSAKGSLDSLSLASRDLRLEALTITPAFTGVTYTLNGAVDINDTGIRLDGVEVADSSTGKGTLNGTLKHNHLKDMALDASLRFRQMELLNLKEEDGMGFYGHMLGSGNVTVGGPLNNIQLGAQATTAGDGDIHVPLNSALVGSTSNLLTFTEPDVIEDPYDLMMNKLRKAKKSSTGSFSAKARVTATPGITAFMELDKDSGNILSAFGSGTVDLDLKPSKDVFTLNGDYNIAGGKFHVNLANLLDRELTIKNGGSIKFNGTIPESELDVTAAYNLRTSLSTLVADSKSVATRRNVEATLRIHDKLSSLATDFDINVPDLDPVTKAQVESALNTEDKVQKQFVALLMLGSFIPGESSGVFNGSNAIYSNVSSIVVGQINSIMQKLDIPVGFGFDYQQSNAGKNIFDVAIGTQLFNNRVEVNGSLGNREYSTSGGQTNIVGDFDASLKLDKTGQFRLNAFSHSADEYTSFLDYSQRNGGGVSYQVDYNNFNDLIQSIFKKKNAAPVRRRRETVTIKIEDEQK